MVKATAYCTQHPPTSTREPGVNRSLVLVPPDPSVSQGAFNSRATVRVCDPDTGLIIAIFRIDKIVVEGSLMSLMNLKIPVEYK